MWPAGDNSGAQTLTSQLNPIICTIPMDNETEYNSTIDSPLKHYQRQINGKVSGILWAARIVKSRNVTFGGNRLEVLLSLVKMCRKGEQRVRSGWLSAVGYYDYYFIIISSVGVMLARLIGW